MKILVIGGTYFLGKAFLDVCDDGKNEIAVLNRGTRPVQGNGDGHVKMFLGDRRDEAKLQEWKAQWAAEKFDVVVDFCAYEAGDVRRMMDILPKGVKQYVFVSTCDVYQRGTGRIADENAALEERQFGGEEGAYISGKVALEKELRSICSVTGMHYTSIRPTFIYGPDNYAPREGIFFHWVTQAGQILFPEDADGTFQMVYVKDVAKCIYASLGEEKVYDCAVNICGDEVIDYEKFAKCLEQAVEIRLGKKIERVNVSVADVLEKGIPLPFPLTRAESERYAGGKARELGVEFTALEDGLRETYAWFTGECV